MNGDSDKVTASGERWQNGIWWATTAVVARQAAYGRGQHNVRHLKKAWWQTTGKTCWRGGGKKRMAKRR